MEKFFIRETATTTKEVEGELVSIPGCCKAFINKTATGWFVVSEFSSGYRIGNGETKKMAIKEASAKIAMVGQEKFAKMISDAVEKHGVANK